MSELRVGLIPARAGSRGLTGKNMKTLGGKPLLAWTIESALQAGIFNEIWVSSDSDEILQVAMDFGVSAHLRSKETSSDSAPASAVVREFLSFRELTDQDLICYLQPTSPFRSSKSIVAAFDLQEKTEGSVVGVRPVRDHPQKLVILNEFDVLQAPSFVHSSPTANRQELGDFFYPNGSVYLFTVEDFQVWSDIPIFGSCPLVMSELESLDIDSGFDFEICERFA
jgi:CMP-N,N'-diacetyllegionaminic acid synthase